MHNSDDNIRDIETGIVTGLRDGQAIIELQLQPACENCGAKVLCVPDENGRRALKVSNPVNAQIGQHVAIGESSDFLLKIAGVQYGIPFLGFLLGIILLYTANISINGIADELIYFMGGLAGLGTSALLSRRLAHVMADSKQSFFTITRIVAR